MAKAKQLSYVCRECGTQYAKWLGQCGQCESWNSIVEIEQAPTAATKAKAKLSSKLFKLSEVKVSKEEARIKTNLEFLDRILGGGLPQGSVTLVAGQPGTGKSTLLFQMLFKNPTSKILYISAEESPSQVAARFGKQGRDNPNFYLLTENRVSEILEQIDLIEPDIVVVDSIQMLMSESVDRMKGGVATVREVAEALVTKAKAMSLQLWIVGHVNKDGDIAGPKTLEHLVDTVLTFSGSDDPQVRVLQTQKHRFGQSGELAVLEMSKDGLSEKPGAESYWMEEHNRDVPGCAFAAVMMGSRVYCVEIQALCAKTHFPSPRRSTTGYDMNRLYLILAVLEKRLKIPFSHLDVYLNVVGGLKLTDPAADLAVAAALVSAHTEKSPARSTVYCGELGLTGEIRKVSSLTQRIQAISQLGKNSFVCAEIKNLSAESMQLVQTSELRRALQKLL